MIEKRVAGILERSATDHEKMVAPRDLWPQAKHKELEEFYEEREKERERSRREGSLDHW